MEAKTSVKSKGKIVGTSITILVALVILSISVLRCATPKIAYEPTNLAYSPVVLSEKTVDNSELTVDYLLAYQGKVGPDSSLWYAKVMRDKIWYLFTFDPEKRIELNLLFADKRLNSAVDLFKNNKPDLGFSTLTKAEKYLEMATPKNADYSDYIKKLALASLKHREIIEKEILPIAPEDIRPNVIRIEDYSIETYKKSRDFLQSKGQIAPVNIFEKK